MNSTIYGNVIQGGGVKGHIVQSTQPLDAQTLATALSDQGFGQSEASELADIAASETPTKGEPIGGRTRAWLARNVNDIARPVITKLLSDMISGT